MIDHLTGDQWQQFERQGYLRLGRLLNDADLFKLQQRVDDIMMGRSDVNYDRMLMQLDEGKEDARRSLPQSIGHKGATLNYRKILHMELDSEYLAYNSPPLVLGHLHSGLWIGNGDRLLPHHVLQQTGNGRHALKLAPGSLGLAGPRPGDYRLDGVGCCDAGERLRARCPGRP